MDSLESQSVETPSARALAVVTPDSFDDDPPLKSEDAARHKVV
jgi:hypothetical protein